MSLQVTSCLGHPHEATVLLLWDAHSGPADATPSSAVEALTPPFAFSGTSRGVGPVVAQAGLWWQFPAAPVLGRAVSPCRAAAVPPPLAQCSNMCVHPTMSFRSEVSLQSPSVVPGRPCRSKCGLDSPEISCPSIHAHGMRLTFITRCITAATQTGLAVLKAEVFQKALICASRLSSHI